MQYYPHHIGDFDKATRHLTRLERSVYRDLIDLYYDTEARLSLDIAWICRKIIARSNEESTAVEQTLNEFFVKTETGWYHSRCEDEIEHYRKNNGQKAKAGKASAASKALKRQHAINGCSTAVDQTNNGVSTNQEPGTSNQEPINTFLVDSVDEIIADVETRIPKTDAERDLGLHLSLVTTGLEKTPNCPQIELIDLYGWRLPFLAQPNKNMWLGGKNATALKARWNWVLTASHETGTRKGARLATTVEEGIAWFTRFFDYIGKSDFLNARSSAWSCDLIWIVNKSNFEKIIQGNYDNKEKTA